MEIINLRSRPSRSVSFLALATLSALTSLSPAGSLAPAFRLKWPRPALAEAGRPPFDFDWSRQYASKPGGERGVTEEGAVEAAAPSVHSLLEDGRIEEAAEKLLADSSAGGGGDGAYVPTSTYHAVIEACCAGGGWRGGEEDGGYRMGLAVELLNSMEGGATDHAREVVVKGWSRRGRWRKADRLLEVLEREGVATPSQGAYQVVLAAMARANQFGRLNSILTRMRRGGVRPNVYTYNSLLKICASDKSTLPRWREALSLLSQCQREPGVEPDLITYTTAMRACARGKRADKSMELFRAAGDMGLDHDVYSFTTAMDACAKGRRWRTALSLLDEMRERGIEPSEVTYGVAVAACGNGGRWEKALELLDDMRLRGMRINTITYNSAIAALSRAARSGDSDDDPAILSEKAMELLGRMATEGVRQDSFTISSVISACGAAGWSKEAGNLIRTMQQSGMRPNQVAYTAAITACAKSRKWEPAFELFKNMKDDRLRPDIVAYNALIGAGMSAERPDKVFELWREMCGRGDNGDQVSPDIVTLTEVVATLDAAPGKVNRERADEVFSEAVGRGLILRRDSLDTSREVDLSNMSFPVARVACRYIFRRIAEGCDGEGGGAKGASAASGGGDLSLITGASRMREYIRGVLRDELRPSIYCVVPESERGTLRVKERMLKNYVEGQSRR